MSAPDWAELERAAIEVRARAYAPYSRYLVGAALLGEDGRVYVGCNVENASYGLTVCAERSACVGMVAAGCRRVAAVVVITAGAAPGSPCGMCRQTLSEFGGDEVPLRMLALDAAGAPSRRAETTLGALLPGRFDGALVLGRAPNGEGPAGPPSPGGEGPAGSPSPGGEGPAGSPAP
ncbi:MAG: cytidine deaminase [Polyangiaceae bacterium]|nr:cytidine deaminase [Polyangiaceae bacterium]